MLIFIFCILGMNAKHISQLKAESEAGISAEAVRCMSDETLKVQMFIFI